MTFIRLKETMVRKKIMIKKYMRKRIGIINYFYIYTNIMLKVEIGSIICLKKMSNKNIRILKLDFMYRWKCKWYQLQIWSFFFDGIQLLRNPIRLSKQNCFFTDWSYSIECFKSNQKVIVSLSLFFLFFLIFLLHFLCECIFFHFLLFLPALLLSSSSFFLRCFFFSCVFYKFHRYIRNEYVILVKRETNDTTYI